MLKKLFFWRKPQSSEADQRVIGLLKREDADPSQRRELLHYLYLPSESAANQVSRDLLADGYTVEMRKASNADQNPPNPWLVLARIVTLINDENVERARNRLTELTSRYGGEYDGWEAAVR